MVTIDVEYSGDLHTVCRHGPSGSEIGTDAPKDNEGRGQLFSPTDLVAAALGSCMLTVMGIAARRRGVSIEGARASVEKHMAGAPLRRIARLVVRIDLPAGVPAEERQLLERTASVCPVSASLHPDVGVELTFRWGTQD